MFIFLVIADFLVTANILMQLKNQLRKVMPIGDVISDNTTIIEESIATTPNIFAFLTKILKIAI